MESSRMTRSPLSLGERGHQQQYGLRASGQRGVEHTKSHIVARRGGEPGRLSSNLSQCARRTFALPLDSTSSKANPVH